MTVDNSLWIRRYHPGPNSGIRLMCLPHAGGSASFYLSVSRALASKLDVVAVQYPGRQDRRREPCIDHVPTLAREIVQVLDGWADRPLALFGHSMGATVAFEMARLLEQEHGITLARLFVSARRAPSRHRDERVHQLDDNGLIQELYRLSGTDSSVLGDEEMVRMVLPAIRADYRAAETYRYQPGPPLNCPITAFIGNEDTKVALDEVQAWKAHTSGPFECRVFPGGHFFLLKHQAEVLEIIVSQLSTAALPQMPAN